MRIGIDARFYGSTGKGLGRYTEKLIHHLERCDDGHEYVIFLGQENFDEYVPKSRRCVKVLATYRWYSFAEQILFPITLYRQRLDLVHFPHFNVPLLYRRRFVVTIHDLILIHYPTIRNTTRSVFSYWMKFVAYRIVIGSAIRRAAHVITVSRFTERDIIEHYPFAAGKISMTYEAADGTCFFALLEERKNLLERLGLIRAHGGTGGDAHDIIWPYLLYVGNAYPHKNLEAIVQAALAFPEYRFVLVGKEDYFYERIRKQAAAHGATNVIFSGFMTDRELSVLYRSARMYVFPSLYEGFGLPLLEAMSYGLPVLASDCGSIPEVAGDAAVLFDPKDNGSLVRAIRSFIEDKDTLNCFRRRGYGRVASFSWEAMAEATRHVYEKAACI
jgi:glycosyltransferase involved in cell wall biosynthesis